MRNKAEDRFNEMLSTDPQAQLARVNVWGYLLFLVGSVKLLAIRGTDVEKNYH